MRRAGPVQVISPASTDVPMLADPTTDQRRAFDLLDTPIPLTAAA